MSKQLCLLFCLLLLMKPSTLCKYFNDKCYKLFFSDGNTTQMKLENATIMEKIELERKEERTGAPVCIEPGYEKVCSGHGKCLSGVCQCERLEPSEDDNESLYEYSGQFCEECPYCKGQRCEKIQPCLECILQDSNCTSYCFIYYNLVEKVEKKSYKEKMCDAEDENGCRIRFKYIHNVNNVIFVDMESQIHCLNGRMYLHICCYGFFAYIFVLMIIFKKCL